MPEFRAPGVFAEEVSFSARAINTVSTSTAAFFGSTPGPKAALRIPTLISSWVEFRRHYVPDDSRQSDSPFATAVHGFFENGGSRLYIVNLGKAAKSLRPEDIALIDAIDGIDGADGISLIAAPGFTDAGSHETLIADCENSGERFAVLDMAETAATPNVLTRSVHNGGVRPRSTGQGVAAVYTPWISVADALTGSRVNAPPSGHVCGLYARTDATHGVHKAPANAPLRGVFGVSRQISTREQEIVSPEGINCIRLFKSGVRVWGARTLAGSNSEFRYIPVRRSVTMISRSIVLGTRWVVFVPNDQVLWNSLRRDIADFLHGLWRDGALAGTKPEDAFFVRCGTDTMTRADIDAGHVIALVGIAPLKPAEFVVIRIRQVRARSAVQLV